VTRSAGAGPGDAIRIALGEGWLDARVSGRDEGTDPFPGRRDAGSGGGEHGSVGSAVDPLFQRR
jgi:exodeoxyribonuclease VII large subunit